LSLGISKRVFANSEKKTFSLIHHFGNSHSNPQPHTNTKILMGLFSY